MAPDASGVVDDLRPNRLCLDVGYSGRHTAGVVSVSRSIYQKYHSVAEELPKSLPNQVVHQEQIGQHSSQVHVRI
jgi:hypothetical protein